MHLRQFEFERDYQSVLALWRAARPGIHVGPSDGPDELARKLQRDPDLFPIAEAAGKLIGTVLGGFDGRRGMVYHLAVDAGWRGQGIGWALMDVLPMEKEFEA